MKRTVATIKQFDYTSKEEFEKDILKMKVRGYKLIEADDYGWSKDFGHGEICGADKDDKNAWKYTAHFIKSDMM